MNLTEWKEDPLHLKVWRMVKEIESEGYGDIQGDQEIEYPSPADLSLEHEGICDHGAETTCWYGPGNAKKIY